MRPLAPYTDHDHCSTLYVGGLPAVLPSLTGPFSAAHLEDTLRNVFSRCPGFRRLSFRAKNGSPIVFVEFQDVIYATQAVRDMYGHTLGGLVKGGIRLSYSKVRPPPRVAFLHADVGRCRTHSASEATTTCCPLVAP